MKNLTFLLFVILLFGCAEEISENPINTESSFGPNFDFKCFNSCKERNSENFCIDKCNIK